MTTHRLHTFVAIIIAAVISGCAVYTPVADFTKQRFTNTVAYFNTFYNAQRLFNDAEDEVLNARRDFLERAVVNKAFTIPSSARQKFQTSIEKNSKVLSFYADSKWVDDALMMIGKAYFYMEDDVRSERKFLELAVQFPNSSFVSESQLWLGKSYLRQKKTDLGIKQLEDVFAKTSKDDASIAGEAAYELAQHYFGLKEFTLAEKYYSLAADLVYDGEVLTQIYFQLGKCYTELQQHDRAMKAYESAADASPVYTWIFQAQLQQIKTKAFQKEYDEALELLREMLSDSKNTEFFGIIHFEIANILSMNGKYDEAEEKYRYVDTAYARTEEAARSYYVLARYYEIQKGSYDSARVLYNKAKMEFPASEITKDSGVKSDIFNKYHELWKDLIKYDSLYLVELYKPEPSDSVITQKADSSVIADSVLMKEEPKVKKMAKSGKQEIKMDSVTSVDSTKMRERMQKERAKAQMIDSLQRTIARTKFELGGLFYLEIQHPDSALRWFDEVITQYPNSQFAPRALYTKAEIYRTLLQKPSTDLEPIYRQIISRYGESSYANEARKNLGIPLIEAEKDTALELFEAAELLAEKKEYQPAVTAFKNIAIQYANSPVAPKALYSAGWHYEHTLNNNDSAYAVYNRLIAKYPLSQFSTAARPKVAEYDTEVNRIAAEQQKAADEAKEKERLEKEAKELKIKSPAPVPADSLPTPKNKI